MIRMRIDQLRHIDQKTVQKKHSDGVSRLNLVLNREEELRKNDDQELKSSILNNFPLNLRYLRSKTIPRENFCERERPSEGKRVIHKDLNQLLSTVSIQFQEQDSIFNSNHFRESSVDSLNDSIQQTLERKKYIFSRVNSRNKQFPSISCEQRNKIWKNNNFRQKKQNGATSKLNFIRDKIKRTTERISNRKIPETIGLVQSFRKNDYLHQSQKKKSIRVKQKFDNELFFAQPFGIEVKIIGNKKVHQHRQKNIQKQDEKKKVEKRKLKFSKLAELINRQRHIQTEISDFPLTYSFKYQ